MPLDIETASVTASLNVEEVCDWLRDHRIDTSSETSFIEASQALKALSKNRTFLGDKVIEELKTGYSDKEAVHPYTAQVIMLFQPEARGDNFFIRANIWPALSDPVVKAAGTGPFFYHRPHDHNFNFLTVGYFGPGYGSNYYEYDSSEVAGYPGEHVPDLAYCRTTALSEGHVMLYRAGRDVHDQLPPDSLSISLNIVENTPRVQMTRQYAFDLETATITQIINTSPAPALFSAALLLDPENGQDIVEQLSTGAANPVTRIAALKALALAAPGEGYEDVIARGAGNNDAFVRGWSRRVLSELS